MLAFINWNVEPEIFSIWGIHLRWYGLLFVSSFFVGGYAFRELLKYDKLPDEFVDRTLWYVMIGTFIGARLGHCLFYDPKYYLTNPLEIFATWKGGLASHGGACGILAALYFLARKTKKSYIWILDRAVIVIGLSAFFIRIANLMNSEIYGIETSLPWGFIFERNCETVPKHPTQIYEALFYLMIYVILRFIYRKSNNQPRPFLMFGLFLIMLFGFRFFIEFIKNPQEVWEVGMKLNMGQLLSMPFIIFGIISLFISNSLAAKNKNIKSHISV